MTAEDEDFLRRIAGLFVGALDADELEAFERLRRAGHVRRSYEGVGGMMGLATVRRVWHTSDTATEVDTNGAGR
jgi:hypothetical protein